MESRRQGFTIIELLVVVSIIALLVGILLPAIGKAREQAQLTKSEANMRNLGTAHATYASEWNDRQFTMIVDSIGRYGDSAAAAFPAFHSQNGGCGNGNDPGCHPPVLVGWAGDGLWGFWMNHPGNYVCAEPFRFSGGQVAFGGFRIPNARQFNQYVSGRFYDPVFYAPKDRAVISTVEPCLDDPGEFCFITNTTTWWSSYCNSPAAQFSPDVLGKNRDSGLYFTDPYEFDGGLRAPAMSAALYPTLKTHMIEHHWLQQARADCNPSFGQSGTYDGCEPFYFNAAFESAPVSLFFDGHIELLGTREATRADARVMQQNDDSSGLWSRDTPLGEDGYFSDVAYDWTTTSFHILTVDGIRGRDKTGG